MRIPSRAAVEVASDRAFSLTPSSPPFSPNQVEKPPVQGPLTRHNPVQKSLVFLPLSLFLSTLLSSPTPFTHTHSHSLTLKSQRAEGCLTPLRCHFAVRPTGMAVAQQEYSDGGPKIVQSVEPSGCCCCCCVYSARVKQGPRKSGLVPAEVTRKETEE